MYQITVFIKNEENPFYQAFLKHKKEDPFSHVYEIIKELCGEIDINMDEGYSDKIGVFTTFSGFESTLTLKNFYNFVKAFEKEMRSRWNITEIYITLSESETPISVKDVQMN